MQPVMDDNMRGGGGSYRRGVTQTLSMVASLVRGGVTADDLDWLCDASMKMRHDPKSHPAYLNELRALYRTRKCEGAML